MPVAPPTRALVRRPSPRLAEGELTHQPRRAVDVARAFEQHEHYVELLRAQGLAVFWAPELAQHPDGLFVEDVLVSVGSRLVLTRPGATSRRGEVASVEAVLAALSLITSRIVAPGALDGGDVLVCERHVLVGQSTRSDDEAVRQLARLVTETPVVGVKVHGALHLKTAVTRLPDGSLFANPACVDCERLRQLGYHVHHAPEPSGANVLCIDQTVLVAADAEASQAQLRTLGFRVLSVDISELQKLEAGLTCMSVLF